MIEQSLQKKDCDNEFEKSKENLDKIVFIIGKAGWPSLECQSVIVVLRFVVAVWKVEAIGKEEGHS